LPTRIIALPTDTEIAMTINAFTILQRFASPAPPNRLADSVLLIIDAQREYLDGHLALPGIGPALATGARLLARARAAGTPVVHVLHRGAGPLFNPETPAYRPLDEMQPQPGESVVNKTLADAFAGTQLQAVLAATGRSNLIVIGFMTHNCVSSTVRAATGRGFRCTVVAPACATRPLPDGQGGVLAADLLHEASLIGLSDTQAAIVRDVADIPD
jgi:nicotinamidase-related amidase